MSPTQTLNRTGEKWENPENGPLLENQFGPGVDQVLKKDLIKNLI